MYSPSVISSRSAPDCLSYDFALHVRKLPIPSVLGRMQQPDPFPIPSTSSLILAKNKVTYHNVALPWRIFTAQGTNTLTLVVLWYTLASTSMPGEMVPLTQTWTRESAPLGLFECPYHASAPFDNHAYSPLQGVHHLNLRVAHSTPAKVSAMASPPIQEVSMHLNSPKPLPLSQHQHQHRHYPSFPATPNASHSHPPTIVTKDASLQHASATTNTISQTTTNYTSSWGLQLWKNNRL